MGQIISYIYNYASNSSFIEQKFIGPEYLDFEGLFMFFKVNRFYEDGFFEILINHNLYGKMENIIRCLRIYGLNPVRFPEFTKLLIKHNSEGFVKIQKDRGLLLLGSVYIPNENIRGEYIELKTLLPELIIKPIINEEKKDLEYIHTDQKDEYEHFNG